ncbi:hypothetical protein [Candidatus Cryosericum terrychapinii]|uniref:HEPN domain-containing protein n=1 Tax=Candidatus Cryosericum terrychapinii TaxID=2290919 RepID=A0A398D5N7_9BACT|nr:hypothetical protein [Candidatus Cryosericum terrychapinii]RIE06801.1 hypothetical protein SMC7_00705 [Candidatus Cryosericum terrychapinii]
MPFSWSDFLKLADQLVNSDDAEVAEACVRAATSKAYYAAFCECKLYAMDRYGLTPGNSFRDHDGVRKQFTKHGMSCVAADLEMLRNWRNACDYDEEVDGAVTMAPIAIQRATTLLKVLKKS